MTKVVAQREKNYFLLRCKGHATGSEQVCAGISGIVYALEGYLINHEEELSAHRARLLPGDAEIEFESRSGAAKAAFEMAVIGLLQIEKGHGDKVRVEWDDRTENPVPSPCQNKTVPSKAGSVRGRM